MIYQLPWLTYDENLLKTTSYHIAIQINGKFRATKEIDDKLTDDQVKELVSNMDIVKKYLGDNAIKKIILIPKKVINIII